MKILCLNISRQVSTEFRSEKKCFYLSFISYKTVADMNDPSTVTDDHLIGAEGFVELTNKIGER